MVRSTTPSNDASSASADESPRPVVFVISPIGTAGTPTYERAKTVLTYVIKKAFPERAWEVVRADDEAAPDSITRRVIDRIASSDYIVADLTDQNPNVFYELAVAHGYEKKIILIIESGQSVPFDIADQRAIDYDLTDPASVDRAISRIQASQLHLQESRELPMTPLTASGPFASISSIHPSEESNAVIADALQDIVSRLSRLEARSTARSSPEKYMPFPEASDTAGFVQIQSNRSRVAAFNGLQLTISALEKQLAAHEGDDSSATHMKLAAELAQARAESELLKKEMIRLRVTS